MDNDSRKRCSTESTPIHALIIGSPQGTQDAVTEMLQVADSAQFFRESPGSQVLQETNPHLILICQNWPDEFTAEQAEWLLTRFPLARIICSYGPWCGSDGRTRTVWPAAIRVPVGEAPRRIRHETEVLLGTRLPLPLTAGLDEIFAFDHSESGDSQVMKRCPE